MKTQTQNKSGSKKKKVVVALVATAATATALLGGSYAAFNATATTADQKINSGTTSLVFSNSVGSQAFNTKIANIAAGDTTVQYFDLTNDGTDDLKTYTIAGDFDGNGVTGAGARAASSLEMIDANGMTVSIVEVNADKTAKTGAVPFTKKIDAASFAPTAFTANGPVGAKTTKHYKVTTVLDTTETAQNKSFVGEYTFAAVQDTDQVTPVAGS